MICSNCQYENVIDAKFCQNCGQKLQRICSNCSTPNETTAKFCKECGTRLEEAESAPTAPKLGDETQTGLQRFIPRELLSKIKSAQESGEMVGERRIVTMLFCDVKGSTAAAGQLDPEEWAEIMNGAFEYMIQPVYRYEGTIARLMGDSVLAFFGAPIAHEDDPERAIRAGLEIVEGMQPYRVQVKSRWELDFDVRVGINTGLVVVGAVGSDMRMEYTALGDAINLAARMEQTAVPGTVQIAEPTYKFIAPLFDFEDLGGIEIKGKDEPVRAYRVLRPKLQPGRVRGVEGLESPIVGRDAEMHTLRGAVIAVREGRGGIISIMGEAGLGKSRLVAELQREPTPVQGGKAPLHWLAGRCLSYQTTTPYTPFTVMFTEHFDLQDGQSDQDKYGRLTQRVAAAGRERVDEIAPFLATLLGVSLTGEAFDRVRYLEPPQMRERIFHAIGTYIECLSIEQPVILLIDDVHWIDPTSLDLLEALLPLTDRTSLLILALFRPRRQEPSWRFHENASRDFAHRYQSLHLNPLGSDDARQLVANLLHIEDLPEKVRALILEKAEGNPFFVEEVIRSLLDGGLVVRQNGHWRATREIESISVPNTLAAVITTRLDRLDEDARRLAQSASVIGREFRVSTLEAVHPTRSNLDAPLANLQRRELLLEKTRIPERSFIFKHVLTQETAYHSLLLKTRRELHLRVAAVLERTTPDRVNDIAHHFLSARQPSRALPYLVEAADRAAKSYATQEAIGFYRQALEILETVDDLALTRRVYEGLGNALTFANQVSEAVQTFQTMFDLAETRDDVPMQVSALNKLSNLAALRMGDFKRAEQFLEQSDHLAREFNDKRGLSEMGLIRCMMCTAMADFDGVVRYMDETVALGRDLGVKEQMTQGLTHIAASQAFLLQFDKAMETYEEGLQLSREIGDRYHEGQLMAEVGPLLYLNRGDFQTAQTLAETGLEIGRTIGDFFAQIHGNRVLGLIAHQQGAYEQAITRYQNYLDISRAAGIPWLEADAMCLLGTAYLDISTELLERVLGFHMKALEILDQPGGAMMGASAWAEIGFCFHAVGKLDEARAYFLKGMDFPTVTIHLERPRLLVGAGMVALKLGQLDEARKQIEEAKLFALEKGMKNLYPLIFFAEGCVAEDTGETENAISAFTRATELALEMNLRPIVWQAQAKTGRIHAKTGHEELASQLFQSAQKMINEIASPFEDEHLRQTFLDHAQQKLK